MKHPLKLRHRQAYMLLKQQLSELRPPQTSPNTAGAATPDLPITDAELATEVARWADSLPQPDQDGVAP